MAGKKGRSGRGTGRSDVIRNQVILKAWMLAHEFLNDVSIVLKDKMDFIARITTKDMPTHLEGEAFGETKIIIVRDSHKTELIEKPQEISTGRTITL